MSEFLKVIDNFSTYIVGDYSSSDTEITLNEVPNGLTAGYLTVFNRSGEQLEKIKFTSVDGNTLSCIRGLSFVNNSDSTVAGNAQRLKNGYKVKLVMTQHYFNDVMDVLNGSQPFAAVPLNPDTRTISGSRELVDKEYADNISASSITDLYVSESSGLTVNIASGKYIINAVYGTFGGDNKTLSDDAESYIELQRDGTVNVETSGSAKMELAAGCDAGDTLATEAISSTDLSEETEVTIWIKSSVDTNSGDLQLLIDDSESCASRLEEMYCRVLCDTIVT